MLKQKIQKEKGFTPTPFIQKGVSLRSKQGFSLLELLIYITILSILVVAISNIFISLSRGNGQSQARSEVDSAIRFTTELIRQDLKNASVVVTPTTAGGTSSTLVLTRNGETITYDVPISGGFLKRNGANITNSNISVSTPTFTRIENTNVVFNKTNVAIKVDMTFSYIETSPDWAYSTSLQTTINLY